ncbi:uncharacterized protein LOC120333701 [Styela clava]
MASPNDKNRGLGETTSRSPTSGQCSSNDVSDQPSTNEFSITNPFENHNSIDSLLQPSFSPSVFRMNVTSETDSQKTPKSFWNIDQIAVLKPMDFDLSSLHNQQDFLRLDPASERRAQQAIDEFFASHIELPSPWSGDRSKNQHLLALISPSPAQMKKKVNLMTPCGTVKPGCSSSSAASSLSSSSQIRVRKFLANNGKYATSCGKNVKDEDVFTEKLIKTSVEAKNVSTQTTLTLPKNFDLEAILGQYYTHEEKTENTSEILNNTSLRRKLFFPDGREVDTRDKHGEININMLQHIDDINDLEQFAESPVPLHKIQPSNNNMTPLTHPTHGDISRTPSTCQSHFSSSPLLSGVGFDPKTPCSAKSSRPRFGSGVRRRKMLLGSSEDEELMKIQMHELDSPELSPVKCDDFLNDMPQSEILSANNENTLEDASMSFNVSGMLGEKSSRKIALEGHSHPPPAMESSRRQLLLDSPPLSPIQPIDHKPHLKKSSSTNQINSSNWLNVREQGRQLCPSPMLSPIPCKHLDKNTKLNTLGIKIDETSMLSSTATRPNLQSISDDFSLAKSAIDFGLSTSKTPPSAKKSVNFDNMENSEIKSDAESNKENILPSSMACSSMVMIENENLNLENTNEDISMILDQTSCNQDLCNDDIQMQFEKHSTSVLYCSQGFSSSNPISAGCSRIQPTDSSDQLHPGNLDRKLTKMDTISPKKLFLPKSCNTSGIETSVPGIMDVSMPQIQCHAFDDTTSSQHPTQGDSGYSTTQSNYQAIL